MAVGQERWSPILFHFTRTFVDELVPEAPRPAGQSGKSYWHGIVSVSNEDSVRVAFEKLVKNNILSAPVRAGLHEENQNTYTGFVDMLDLVDFVVKKIHIGSQELATVEEVQTRLNELQETLNHSTVKDLLVSPSHRSTLSCYPVPDGVTIFSVFDMLAWSGSYRLPVLNSSKKVVNVITQSMLMKYIFENIQLVPQHVREKPVREFVDNATVVTLHESKRAIHACQLMCEKGVNGIAIVNDEGQIVDSFSVKDLRGVGLEAQQIWRLFMPVLIYKKKQVDLFPHAVPSILVQATLDDPFEKVLQLFVGNRTHRVWVVDSVTGKPTHRITPQQMLQVVFGERNDD